MSDDELSPEQERVRALLAEARVDTPIPDDVAARLDRVLAQLAETRAEEGDSEGPEVPATVVDLAARRRRKAVTLLVAAVAVVAVGIGLGSVVPSAREQSDSAGDSGAAAESVDDGAAPEAEPGAGAPESTARMADGGPVVVRPGHFADDVAELRDVVSLDAPDGEAAAPSQLSSLGGTDSTSSFICDPAAWGEGRLVAAFYGGVPAVLAFRPPTGDTQVVDLLECGTAAILRSVTLPAS